MIVVFAPGIVFIGIKGCIKECEDRGRVLVNRDAREGDGEEESVGKFGVSGMNEKGRK